MNTIGPFVKKNRDVLVIMADPKTNVVTAFYKGKVVAAKIRQADGSRKSVVRNALKHSVFENNIDQFIMGIAEVLRMKLNGGASEFLRLIGGMTKAFGDALKRSKTH